MCDWLDDFQMKVNELTGCEHLQLPVDIWNPDAPIEKKARNRDLAMNHCKSFPYLCVELYWQQGHLKFRIHLKPNQQLKYLNKGSTHTTAYLESIPHGVIQQLSILTLLTRDNENRLLNELYPKHSAALE